MNSITPEKSDQTHRRFTLHVWQLPIFMLIVFSYGSAGNHFVTEKEISVLFEQNPLSWETLVSLHENIQEAIEKHLFSLKLAETTVKIHST